MNLFLNIGTLVTDLGNAIISKFGCGKAAQNSGKSIDLSLDRLALNPISLTLTSYVYWGRFL